MTVTWVPYRAWVSTRPPRSSFCATVMPATHLRGSAGLASAGWSTGRGEDQLTHNVATLTATQQVPLTHGAGATAAPVAGVQPRRAGQVPVLIQVRLSAPRANRYTGAGGTVTITGIAVIPEVSLPPSECQPGVTPAVRPENSLYQAALSVPRTNATPIMALWSGTVTAGSLVVRPPSERHTYLPPTLGDAATHGARSVPTAATKTPPDVRAAAGPVPGSSRPPMLRHGCQASPLPVTRSRARHQTAPSAPRAYTAITLLEPADAG